MRTICSREIFTRKWLQQQIFYSDLKGAWHYNHVTFTPIAKNFMLYWRLIYMLSILWVRLTINVKVGLPESFKVGWYPPKKAGSSHLKLLISSTLTNLCCFFVTEVRRLCVNEEGWRPRDPGVLFKPLFFTIKKQTAVGLFWIARRWKKNAKSYILYIFGIAICKWSWKFCSRNSSLLECGRVGTPFVDVVIHWINNNNKSFNAHMSVAILYTAISRKVVGKKVHATIPKG